MSKINKLFIGFYVITLLAFWLNIGGSALQNLVYVLAPLFALLGGVYAIKAYGSTGSRAFVFIFLTLGILCYFIGESLWVFYDYILNTDPFPSAADVFYLAAYPLLFLALVKELIEVKVSLKKLSTTLYFFVISNMVFLLCLVSYFGIYLAYDAALPALENYIVIAYGLGDMLLVFIGMFILLVAIEYKEGKISKYWIAFLIGLLLQLLADILFAIFTTEYEAKSGYFKPLMDSIWILGYLFFAYALIGMGNIIKIALNRLNSTN